MYKPLEYDLNDLTAKAKLREIVVDDEMLDLSIKLSLSGKMAVDDKYASYNDNRVVWTLEVVLISRSDGNEILKYKDGLEKEVDTLVDITQYDKFGWHYRKIEADGKTIFEEQWHENAVNGHNKPSEDFNKSTEDFIIDEFLPDARIMMTLNQ